MKMININFQIINYNKKVLIPPSEINKDLSKPEDRLVLRKHPKTPNQLKGMGKKVNNIVTKEGEKYAFEKILIKKMNRTLMCTKLPMNK